MTSSYGRQWFNPRVAASFDPQFLHADELAMQGHTVKAINIYRELAIQSTAAKRRLNQARHQVESIYRNPSIRNSIRISHIDWYQGFSLCAPFIKQILNGLDIPWYESSVQESDLIIAGCYGNKILLEQQNLNGKFIMFLTGENLFPSYDIHDFSLTTTPNTFCGKNIRYPQWYSEINFVGKEVSLNYADRIFMSDKKDICFSAIYNNSTPQREELIWKIKKLFGDHSVHIFGSQRGGEVDKLSILARSRINICFENSINNGYCTEKLLHALSLGCDAVYWGDKSYSKDFKTNHVFNLYDSSYDSLFEWCKQRLSAINTKAIHQPLGIAKITQSQVSLKPIVDHIRKWTSMINNFRNPLNKE